MTAHMPIRSANRLPRIIARALIGASLLVAMAVGPLLSWKRGDLWAALQRLKLALAIAGAAWVITLAAMGISSLGAACGLAIAASVSGLRSEKY